MIEFDDAGGGCPILGESFVAHDLQNKTAIFRYVPHTVRYRTQAVMAHLTAIMYELEMPKHEEIVLCRGHIFDPFEHWLKENGFSRVCRSQIKGKTNDLVEGHFDQMLRQAGLPSVIQLHDRDFFRFYSEIMLWHDLVYLPKGGPSLRKVWTKGGYQSYVKKFENFPHLIKQLFNEESITNATVGQ